GLMDELGKVKRVVEKHGPVDEVLLVLDATTGQNGMVQARVFREVVDITGIVLTKLDGTAKGGIVVAVQRELGVPVKLVGLGEGGSDGADRAVRWARCGWSCDCDCACSGALGGSTWLPVPSRAGPVRGSISGPRAADVPTRTRKLTRAPLIRSPGLGVTSTGP